MPRTIRTALAGAVAIAALALPGVASASTVSARRHFKIAAGKTAGVQVKLDRRTFRRFRGRSQLKARVTVTMTNATGTTTSTRTVALRRSFGKPKRRRK